MMMRTIAILFFLAPFFAKDVNGYSDYRGYQVYQVVEDENNAYRPKVSKSLSILSEKRVFVKDKVLISRSYLVSNESKKNFLRDLDIMNAARKLTVTDLGRLIHDEKVYIQRKKWSPGDFRSKTLLPYDEMSDYLKYIAKIKNPRSNENIAQLELIGNTHEDRIVYGVKISSNHKKEKPIVFVEAGLKGREWTSTAAARYLINQLVENYTHNVEVLRDVDFYVIPLSNPDGHEYARREDRLWIKNRSVYNGTVVGVDLSKNFDFPSGIRPSKDSQDNKIHHSSNVEDAQFEPFSEPETRHIRSAGMKYKNRIKVFVSIQSVGSLVLYPWGYTKNKPPKYSILHLVAERAAEAMTKFGLNEFTAGQSSNFLCNLGGTIDDYFMGALKVKTTFTMKLSSSSRFSYVLPVDVVYGIVREAYEGLKIMAKYALWDLEAK